MNSSEWEKLALEVRGAETFAKVAPTMKDVLYLKRRFFEASTKLLADRQKCAETCGQTCHDCLVFWNNPGHATIPNNVWHQDLLELMLMTKPRTFVSDYIENDREIPVLSPGLWTAAISSIYGDATVDKGCPVKPSTDMTVKWLVNKVHPTSGRRFVGSTAIASILHAVESKLGRVPDLSKIPTHSGRAREVMRVLKDPRHWALRMMKSEFEALDRGDGEKLFEALTRVSKASTAIIQARKNVRSAESSGHDAKAAMEKLSKLIAGRERVVERANEIRARIESAVNCRILCTEALIELATRSPHHDLLSSAFELGVSQGMVDADEVLYALCRRLGRIHDDLEKKRAVLRDRNMELSEAELRQVNMELMLQRASFKSVLFLFHASQCRLRAATTLAGRDACLSEALALVNIAREEDVGEFIARVVDRWDGVPKDVRDAVAGIMKPVAAPKWRVAVRSQFEGNVALRTEVFIRVVSEVPKPGALAVASALFDPRLPIDWGNTESKASEGDAEVKLIHAAMLGAEEPSIWDHIKDALSERADTSIDASSTLALIHSDSPNVEAVVKSIGFKISPDTRVDLECKLEDKHVKRLRWFDVSGDASTAFFRKAMELLKDSHVDPDVIGMSKKNEDHFRDTKNVAKADHQKRLRGRLVANADAVFQKLVVLLKADCLDVSQDDFALMREAAKLGHARALSEILSDPRADPDVTRGDTVLSIASLQNVAEKLGHTEALKKVIPKECELSVTVAELKRGALEHKVGDAMEEMLSKRHWGPNVCGGAALKNAVKSGSAACIELLHDRTDPAFYSLPKSRYAEMMESDA